MASVTPPRTYSQWLACLDALNREDDPDAVLRALDEGQFAWSAGAAERLVDHLAATVDQYLSRTARNLQRDLNYAAGREAPLVNAIMDARRRLAFALRLARLPALPEYVRGELARAVQGYADQAQEHLERSARADRSGLLPRLLRGNPLNRLPAELSAPPAAPVISASGLGRRGILFGE